jgi:hypothetical protein
VAAAKRSQGQRRHLVNEFRKGTLGKHAFRRLHGIGQSTFEAWLREFALEATSSSFLPVRVEPAAVQERVRSDSCAVARIVSPRGVVLEFAEMADPSWVAAICREVL